MLNVKVVNSNTLIRSDLHFTLDVLHWILIVGCLTNHNKLWRLRF